MFKHHDQPDFPTDRVQRLTLLWMETQPMVKVYLRCVVSDASHAEDLLQQTALTVVEKFSDFSEGTSFKAWAMAIARNKVLNYRRVRARDRHVFDEQTLSTLTDAHMQIEPELDDRKVALKNCLEKLAGRNRKAIELRYQSGQKINDIAERLEITPNALHVLLHRVRVALAQCIERVMREREVPS